jgi:2-aminoadipate transaminase
MMSFDYRAGFRASLPAAAPPWHGFPAYNFVGGHMDPDHVPVVDLISALTNTLEKEGQTLATYNLATGPLGYLPLREFLVGALKKRAAMEITSEEVLITSGFLQSMDLVNQLMLDPGDLVITEAATYGGALTRLTACGARYVGVDLDEDGMRMDVLEETLRRLTDEGITPKMIYTIPTAQNPTGTVMPQACREQMLQLADRFGVMIFEDDCYADLLWQGPRPPAIYSLDEGRRVIYCGSFSKSIAPSLRLGYVVADWTALSRIVALKTDAGTSALEQMALGAFCGPHFDAHVEKVVKSLKEKHDLMAEVVSAEFGAAAQFAPAKGGIFLWIKLPDSVDTGKLAAVADGEGMSLNPGAEWTVNGDAHKSWMRLCFANASHQQIVDGVQKLAAICHREFGVPVHGRNVPRQG